MNETVVVRAATSSAAHARLARLAGEIWRQHYPGIISNQQIDYMLARGYSAGVLAAEQAAGTRFTLAWLGGRAVGFAGLSPNDGTATAGLDKLYVHADARRRGVARALVRDALAHARAAGANLLALRVNRHNRGAIAVYQRLGFVCACAHVKDIGHGFVMDDYVMTRTAAEPLEG